MGTDELMGVRYVASVWTKASMVRKTAAIICILCLVVWSLPSLQHTYDSTPELAEHSHPTFHDQIETSPPAAPSEPAASTSIPVPVTPPSTTKLSNELLPWSDAAVLCAQDGMEVYPERSSRRKVYDLFPIGSELDWLEIRLNELVDHVDYFVIIEAEKTFSNKSKPTYFKKNWKHFERFESKIIYHVLNDDAINDAGAWDREHYQRDAMLLQVFPSLLGDRAPELGDVILVSDVDEIPKRETIEKLRNCNFPDRVTLQSLFYLYSFQFHRTDGDWGHPQATYWNGLDTIRPESLRMTHTAYEYPKAAWHCTNCFATLAEFVNKVESFSHQEFNRPEFKDPEKIVSRIRNGTDVFDRDLPLEKVDNTDLPTYLAANAKRFAYLLDRDPANANLRDYVPSLTSEYYDLSG